MRIFGWVRALLLLTLVACAGLPTAVVAPPASSTPAPTPTSTSLPASSPTPSGPTTLRIWLPPEFDPNSGTPAGNILQARLNEFVARRPKVRIEVRVKSMDGAGGLLDSLTNATAAAPLAMPDLVALPRPLMEVAALKGLLHPIDDLTETINGPDWYDYARQLARLQNSTFGLPFAGDALVLVYRSTTIAAPPKVLTSTLTALGPLAFPAADPMAKFTLAQYQAVGGSILDEQGRPFLERDALNEVLTFYQQASASGVLPVLISQYQSDDQVWEAFLDNQTDMVVTWISRHLSNLQADTAFESIPTLSGIHFTLATGWVWGLASPNHENQALSVELAEFLVESDFLASWSTETGYFPPRPSSLTRWRTTSVQTMASEIVLSARLYPSADVSASLAPSLQQATLAVLKGQSDALTATREALNKINKP